MHASLSLAQNAGELLTPSPDTATLPNPWAVPAQDTMRRILLGGSCREQCQELSRHRVKKVAARSQRYLLGTHSFESPAESYNSGSKNEFPLFFTLIQIRNWNTLNI